MIRGAEAKIVYYGQKLVVTGTYSYNHQEDGADESFEIDNIFYTDSEGNECDVHELLLYLININDIIELCVEKVRGR